MYSLQKLGIIVLIFCIFAFSGHGLDLRGDHLSPIIFEPGKKIVNHYVIDGTDKKVTLSLGGELLEYVQVTEVINNQFDLIIEVPEKLPEPGSYSFSLQVTEVSDSDQSGVGSLVSVSLRFIVEVPPHGKAISISFDVPDINEHEPVPFSVKVESKGLEDITSLKGFITIYDLQNKSRAFLSLKEKPLPALVSTSLSASLPPDRLAPGRYRAEAVVDYDGKEKAAQDTFKIGNLDLILLNYSSRLEKDFGEFWAIVENNWGNPIQTVYATVSINGTELLTTPTLSLGPWQRDTLNGILRTDFAPGNYSGIIQLFYDDLSKTEEVMFTIFEPPKETQKTSAATILIISGILLLIVISFIIGQVLIKKQRNKKNKKSIFL
ncbi:MAG: hypothetical protein Q8R47_05425 [Nanoarchaeota archaeon]|nr:hypothetical protein [Nanoarchaeota archaeon]